MSNKVVNIMPDTPKNVLDQCTLLAKEFSSCIYKILIGFPLLFPCGEEFRPIALILCTKGIVFYTRNKSKVIDEELYIQNHLNLNKYLRMKNILRFHIKPFVIEEKNNIYETAKDFIQNEGYVSEPLDVNTMRYIESALTGMLTKKNSELFEKIVDEDKTLKAIREINYGVATFDDKQYQCIEARSNYKITAIRGLAGCGKTVVLCKIAANEIYRNPDIKICYTYQTRSMYGQVKTRIKDFLISSGIDDIETAMERIDIMGSWGGYGNPGLLNQICHELNVVPLNLEGSKMINLSNPLLGFCDYVSKALGTKKLNMYDYILIDEAQDLNPTFLKLCMKILKKDGKLIYAYDDFQTLSDTTLPQPKTIFPKEKSIQTFPLSICYRTPPKILSLAHALSMGIYCNPPTFYQFPANPSDWEAMGYDMEKGEGKVGQETVLSRKGPEYYSSLDTSAVSTVSPRPGETSFDLLARRLKKDLIDGIVPEDILVIDLDGSKLDFDYQQLYFAINSINEAVKEEPVQIYFAGSLNPNVFRRTGYITFSGIKRAKGNEAFRVYLLNAAKTMSQQFPIVWRNRLFTAMTRTRLQIVIINSEEDEQKELTKVLVDEMHRSEQKDYKLEFIYPSVSEVRKIIETAKTEERAMGEADSISEKIKQIIEFAGADRTLNILDEVLSNSLSPDDKQKLLEILKGNK